MTVTSVEKDPAALTLTITSELAATVERAWQLLADPRQLERWWGPPTYPATVVDHAEQHQGRFALGRIDPVGLLDVLEVGGRQVELPTVVAVFRLKAGGRRLP